MDAALNFFAEYKFYIIAGVGVLAVVLLVVSDIFKGFVKNAVIAVLVAVAVAFGYNYWTGESILDLPGKLLSKGEDTGKSGSQMNYYRKNKQLDNIQ